jgi:hypothetical protein
MVPSFCRHHELQEEGKPMTDVCEYYAKINRPIESEETRI